MPGYDIWSAGIILYELISGSLPYESKNAFTMLDLIRSNQRLPLSDAYSKNLRDVVDKMLNIDINQRISTKEIQNILKSSFERAYLDELLAKKGKKLASNIYRGSIHGFMHVDFHSRCDGVGPTVSLFKVKQNQHWIGGYTNV